MSSMTMSPATIPAGRAGARMRQSRHLALVPASPVAAVESQSVTLRLTRRGRLAVTTMVASALVLGGAVGAQQAMAESQATARPTQTLTVEPGQSLWSIAVAAVPDADPRDVILDIQRLNDLSTSQLVAGQALVVPSE